MILQVAAQKQTRGDRKEEVWKARVEKMTAFSGVQFSGKQQEYASAGDTLNVPW